MAVNGTELEARYRQALLGQQEVSKVVLADGQSVEVKDIYVRRTLLHEVVQKQPEGEITVKLPVDLWPKLRDERVVLVEGPAGMGKSTLTKQLVRESETYHLIPIWIPFRTFVASGLTILEYLDQHYVPWLGLSDLRVLNYADEMEADRSLGQWCYDQWQSGLGVLILDGLDEVFRHEERVAALKALPITGTDRTRPATILTSRPLSQRLLLQMEKVEVQGLTPSDQGEFMKQYRATLQLTDEQITRFSSETQKQSRLQSLLTRPGHLIQILSTYARTNTLLNSETAVLNSLLESRLAITGRSQPPVERNDEKKRQVLMSLALHLLACRQGQQQTRAQLLALIQQVLHEQKQAGTPLFPLSQATALLNDLTRNSGLLTEVDPEVYEFEAVIWLQHLTGAALADEQTFTALRLNDKQVVDFLDRKAWDPEWEPVLKSWVGNRYNPFPLFARLMKKQHDDLARHRLGLAGRCLVEIPVDPQSHAHYQILAERIPTDSFAMWKVNVEWNSEQLVAVSLGKAWVETEVGQKKLLGLLQGPYSLRKAAARALGELGEAMPDLVQQALVAQLADPDDGVRCAVVDALAKLGATMPVAVQDALVARLADPDKYVRLAAIEAFEKLGAAMPIAAPEAFVALVKDPDYGVHVTAYDALEKLAAVMPVVVQQALVARLAEPDKYGRLAAIEALSKLGAAMSDFVQQALAARLADTAEDVRSAAAGALRWLGPAMPVVVQQALVGRLADPAENVRGAAAEALGRLGPAMPDFVQQALVAQVADPERYVRLAVIEALEKLGAAMPVVVQQALVGRLADPAEYVRRAAVCALAKLGPAMPGAVQAVLVARLADADEFVRQAGGNALRGLGLAMAVPVQQALVAQVADPGEDMRRAAVHALGGPGKAMSGVVQAVLVARLADPAEHVRRAAVHALGELGGAMPGVVQEALVGRLVDSAEYVREAAVTALGGLGETMPDVVQEALVARLEDQAEYVCRAAVRAIGELGAAMPGAVQEVLVARLADPNRYVRYAVIRALGELGVAMPGAVQEALVMQLADPDDGVRWAAVESLGRLGPGMPCAAQQALVVRLADPHSVTRAAAIKALEKLGEAMPGTVQEALVARLADPNKTVSMAAAEVLSSVQQQRLRLFLPGTGMGNGRLVSELSATTPLSDLCQEGVMNSPTAPTLPVFRRLSLTVL